MPFFNTIASGANIARIPTVARFIEGLESRMGANVTISDIVILSPDICDIYMIIAGQPRPRVVRLFEDLATIVPTYTLTIYA